MEEINKNNAGGIGEGEIWVEIDETDPKKMAIVFNQEVLSSAIEKGIDKGLEDLAEHFKKQTKIFAFALLGILAILAIIALVLASYHQSIH